jgi:hypothetical protein
MVFVADRIPRELARIVEFLNEQMRPAEVMAIEIDQFEAGDGRRILVPRLIGATERANASKSVSTASSKISKEEWFQLIEMKHQPSARHGAEMFADWLEKNGFDVVLGSSQDSLAARVLTSDERMASPFFIRRSSGRIEISLPNLAEIPPFADDTSRSVLIEEIKKLPAKTLKITGRLTGWPSISLTEFDQSADLRARLFSLVISIRDQLKGSK